MSTPISAPPIQCQICDRKFKTTRSLGIHLSRTHKISGELYFNVHLNQNSSACLTCGSPTNLISFVKGYHKFCSIGCNNRNLELSMQRAANAAKTHQNNPAIRQEATIKRGVTLKDNPQIIIDKTEKLAKTLKDNPQIMINRAKKRAKTLKDNPEIMIRAGKNIANTLRQNPQIKEEAKRKCRETHANNPDIRINAAKLTSIGLRDHYNALRQDDSSVCNVYIISHLSLDIVKIGRTTNLGTRMKRLRTDFGPMEIVKTLVITYDRAAALETKMHKHFKDQCKVQPSGGGRTEWFDSCITKEAIEMLTDSS